MGVVVVTGSAGLIGAEAVRFLAQQGFDVVGIDNDMRRVFFGNEASTAWNRQRIEIEVKGYRHIDGDIRDTERAREPRGVGGVRPRERFP